MSEHIVAVFQSEQPAMAAVQELEKAGVPPSAIRKYAAAGSGSTAQAATTSDTASGTAPPSNSSSGSGFWSWVLGEGSSTGDSTRDAYPDDALYGRHYEAGNTVVSITLTDDSKIHDAIAILEAHHPLDIDESTDEPSVVPGLESGGRTSVAASGTDYSGSDTVHASDTMGSAPTAATAATAVPKAGLTGAATSETAGASPSGAVAGAGPTTGTPVGTTVGGATGTTAPAEQVIQLSEEQLDVGTRTVERGTTRVRRYVVSRPVEKEVTLHGERVTIERRRPVTSASPAAGAFEERVVEVRETEEVPVVEKTARVVEEVAIRREETERKETVRDTVRREELEVAPDKDSLGSESHSAD